MPSRAWGVCQGTPTLLGSHRSLGTKVPLRRRLPSRETAIEWPKLKPLASGFAVESARKEVTVCGRQH